MLRIFCTAAVAVLAWSWCFAQEAPRDSQAQKAITAAVNDAVSGLRRQVEQMPLNDRLTVRDLLHDTGGADELTQTLRRAQIIGGPRWTSQKTCEVRLEIQGSVVAHAISDIAAAHGPFIPIKMDQLQKTLATWRDHEFAAEGRNHASPSSQPQLDKTPAPPTEPTSRPADLIPERPPAWVDRQIEVMGESSTLGSALQTLHAAQTRAHEKLRGQVNALPLEGSLTLGQAADREPQIDRAIERGLDRAEIDRVRYEEHGAVRLRLSLNLWQLWRELIDLPR